MDKDWDNLGTSGTLSLRRAIVGSCFTAYPVDLRMREKILFQYPLIHGHSQKIWRREPMWPHPLKQYGED